MLAFVLLFAPVVVGQGGGQGGGSLDGKVVNPNTGQPVAGVDIVLYTRQALRYETTSDGGGGFQFADVKPGSYEVRLEKEGYTFGRREPAQPYRIAAGQPAIHVRLEMSRRAALSGRVVDGEGKPVRAQVKLAEGGLAAAVNEDGEFAIKDVEPGFYTLLAMPQAAISKEAAPKSANDAERVEPVATYYPSASDSAGAQKIAVRGDTDITGLEIRMQTAEVHRVRGVVLNENGSPTAGAQVSLAPLATLPSRTIATFNGLYVTILPAGRGVGPEQAQTTTDSNGTFEFPSVPTGDWQISARKSPVSTVDFPAISAGAVAALVGHADIQGLQVQQGSSFTLTGTIDWGDLPKKAGAVSLISADGQSGGLASFGPSAGLQPNAGLQLRAVPGRYYIVPQFSAGYYPGSVTLGGRDVMGQAVDLFPGSPPLQVSYKPALGSVRGKVDNAASNVILLPDQVTTVGFGRMAQAKADGTFEIPGVAPGSYIIAALSGMDQRARLDSAVLAKVASSGARVRVEQSPVEGIELTAAPWLQ
ncbi:MAG TPA: carboxypeptidase regulatory-like domain-containing protein [Bryobacteraceae bacterium]